MQMKAATIRRYGPPETIQIREVPVPAPKPDEVRVKVHAACATAASAMMRAGTPRFARLFLGLRGPRHAIPGSGFAGIVESVGAGVSRFAVGDAVFGETAATFGTNAEFVCVPEDALILPKPDSLSFQQAATMCDGPLTSYNFIVNHGAVAPGQRVLVIGASGALGSAAVQIAKALGAHVTGVCSGKNVGFVRDLGADETIDYTQEDYTKTGPYDVIYDSVGASSYGRCKRALAETGRFLTPVLSLRIFGAMLAHRRSHQVKFDATGLKKPAELWPMMQALLGMVDAGQLTVPITRAFPLERIVEAHRLIDTGHKRGALVLTV